MGPGQYSQPQPGFPSHTGTQMPQAPMMGPRMSGPGPMDSMYTAGPPPMNPESAYMPPPHPPAMSEAGRPMSAYNPPGPPPGRPQSQYTARPPSQYRPQNKSNAHYGHLVSEEPERDIPCSGDACGACCKYNTIACLFCCNGWLRCCGRGMSIKDILSFK
ncbi:hypothetical protein GGI07_002234 [Coemansia sp. Benny D115]|nr:hypothetical protein GGI07_002234 [Coemansia sp. Benny D115]